MQLPFTAGDRIGLLSSTRIEWLLADLGILGAAGVTVPVYPTLSPQEAHYIIEHSQMTGLIVETSIQAQNILAHLKAQAKTSALRWISWLDGDWSLESRAEYQTDHFRLLAWKELFSLGENLKDALADRIEQIWKAQTPDSLLTICYTSGTTGTPKGVMITHGNIMAVMSDCLDRLGHHIVPSQERILTFLPFSHIIGKVEELTPWVVGWNQYFARSIDQIPEDLIRVRPTILFAVPRIFEKISIRIRTELERRPTWLQNAFDRGVQWSERAHESSASILEQVRGSIVERGLAKLVGARLGGSLKFVVCGGAPLEPDLGKFFQACGICLLEGYGLTETAGPATLSEPESLEFGSVGKPLRSLNVRMADDGEIWLKGPSVSPGYFRNDDANARSYSNGFFKTGDIGRFDSSGCLWITDRKKNLIITSGGKNIAPQKLETLLSQIPLVAHALAYGDRRPYLVALLSLDRAAVLNWAQDQQILFTRYIDLLTHPKLIAVLQKGVHTANEQVAQFETIKRFSVIDDEFSVEGGQMTPSLKLKRHALTEKYRTVLEQLYIDTEAKTD